MIPNRTLSHARALRGWSQGAVAEKLGTSRKNVSRWECGETFPSPYYRELLCQLFGLDARSLSLLPSSGDSYNSDLYTNSGITEPLLPIISQDQHNIAQNFIGHEMLLHDLLYQLHPGSSLALTGLPGIGKTAIVGKLLHYPQIRERFPDGVFWIKLGHAPHLYHSLAWIAGLLGFPVAELVEAETERLPILTRFLSETFSTRRLLIVLDDVWTVEAALPFLTGSPSVAYILTTRLPKIAFSLASQQPYVVPSLSFEASLQLLKTFVPRIEVVEKTLQREIVEYTGGLPLAITLVGKHLGFQSYGGQLHRLEAALNQLTQPIYRLRLSYPSLASHIPYAQNNDTVAYSLDKAISLSTQHLSEEALIALYALSILPKAPESFTKDAACAVAAVRHEVLDMLVDEGLLEPIEERRYRMHQVIADYAYYHLKESTPRIRLVRYMEKVCVDHKTNRALLKWEYSTLLAGLNEARALKMHNEMIRGTLVLVPLIHMYGETKQAELYLRKALHCAIDLQDQSLCQEILSHLAGFAQLCRDETQFTAYQSLKQMLENQQANNYTLSRFVTLQKIVKEQFDTPRRYVF